FSSRLRAVTTTSCKVVGLRSEAPLDCAAAGPATAAAANPGRIAPSNFQWIPARSIRCSWLITCPLDILFIQPRTAVPFSECTLYFSILATIYHRAILENPFNETNGYSKLTSCMSTGISPRCTSGAARGVAVGCSPNWPLTRWAMVYRGSAYGNPSLCTTELPFMSWKCRCGSEELPELPNNAS